MGTTQLASVPEPKYQHLNTVIGEALDSDFAVGEILSKAEEGGGFGEGNVLTKISTKLPSIANLLALKWTMLRSAVIGTFIDILPGVGAVSVPWGDTGIPPDGGGRVCYGRALDRASITSTSCEESWLPPPRPIRALNICATRAVPGSAMPRTWACRSEFRLSDQLSTYAFTELAIRPPTHPPVHCHSDPGRRPRQVVAPDLSERAPESDAEAGMPGLRSP